jgi:hypothetical protein
VIEINDENMRLVVDGQPVATARFSKYAAADGNGPWIVSTHLGRLSCRNHAIRARALAERLAAGFGDDDAFVETWRRELFLRPADSPGALSRWL